MPSFHILKMERKYKVPTYQLRFSNWHHKKLNGYCSAFNIDYVEIRYGKVVALIEYKRDKEEMTKIERKFLPIIARKLNVPYYIVSCDIDVDGNMEGTAIIEGEIEGEVYYKENLTEKELIKWYEELGK